MPVKTDYRGEVQGSIVYASWQFFQRNAKVTHYAWYDSDRIEGHRLQLLNPDESRTFAAIHRHGTRLYILEASVPKGAPAPGLFQQSLRFLDETGAASLSSLLHHRISRGPTGGPRRPRATRTGSRA